MLRLVGDAGRVAHAYAGDLVSWFCASAPAIRSAPAIIIGVSFVSALTVHRTVAAGSAVWVLIADAAVSIHQAVAVYTVAIRCVVTFRLSTGQASVWRQQPPVSAALELLAVANAEAIVSIVQLPNARIFYDPPGMIAWIYHG